MSAPPPKIPPAPLLPSQPAPILTSPPSFSSMPGLPFPPSVAKAKTSSTEKIWGSKVYGYGYAAVPSILLQAQRKLGLNNTQLVICIQLLDYWHDPSRKPFPSKRDLAERMGVTEKTIQTNVKDLENRNLIFREVRKTAAGDWGSNIYHLDGLIKAVQQLEPEFTAEKKRRKEAQSKLRSP